VEYSVNPFFSKHRVDLNLSTYTYCIQGATSHDVTMPTKKKTGAHPRYLTHSSLISKQAQSDLIDQK
jgi:hypothetical protein